MKKGSISPKVPTTHANDYFVKEGNKMLTKIVADSPEFIPVYKTKGAACCDLKANIPEGELHIGSLETVKVDCGFSMQVPKGFEAQIRPRSSFGAQGIIVPNSPGTIDDDYRGRLMILLTNLNTEPVVIKHLERIGQMALKPVWYFDFQEINTLDNTERGIGGFGSTT